MIDDRRLDSLVEKAVSGDYFEPCYFSLYRRGVYKACRVVGAYRIAMSDYHKSNNYYVVCENCIKHGQHRAMLKKGTDLGIPCSKTSAKYYFSLKYVDLVGNQKRLEQEVGRTVWPQCWE